MYSVHVPYMRRHRATYASRTYVLAVSLCVCVARALGMNDEWR